MRNSTLTFCRTFLLTVLVSSIIHPVYSQKKTLTLEDAVVKQYQKFYPDRLWMQEWIPETESYSFIRRDGNSQTLVMRNVESNESKDLFTTKQLSALIKPETPLLFFPLIEWLNATSFRFSVDNQHFKVSIDGSQVEMKFTLPEGAEEITFNADFSACAFVMDHNVYYLLENGTQIQITSDGKPGIVYGQTVHRSEFGIHHGLFWAPDNKKLAFYRMDETMVDDYPLVDISEQPAALSSIKYPMAGRTSHEVTLGVFDPQKSKTVYMNTGEPKEQYLTSVTWSPASDEMYIALLNRDQNQLKLNRYNASTGALVKTLFEEADNEYVEPEHSLWFIPFNAQQFIWMSEREGFNHLYLYDVDGNLIRPLTFGKWVVKKIIGFDDTQNYLFVEGTGETTIAFDRRDDSKNATQRYTYMVDFEFSETKILDDRKGTHNAILSDNGAHLIEDYTSIDIPLQTTLWKSIGKKIEVIHDAENPLSDYAISTPEIFSLENGNSDLLYALTIKPSNFDSTKQYPVLLYLYGGPHVQLVTDRHLAGAPMWMYWMAEQGYIVATIDSRGSGNRGIEFEQATFRNLGTVEMDDQKKFIEYLSALPYVDKDRMAIHGWSYGGFMTINMMLTFPGLFKVGVAGGPVCDWSMYEIMYTERYMDTPEMNPEGYKNANLIDRASALEDDLLLIHGTMDDVVLWQHSQAFVKNCIDNETQLDYFIYPGHKHNVFGRDKLHLMKKTLNYIDERIGESK